MTMAYVVRGQSGHTRIIGKEARQRFVAGGASVPSIAARDRGHASSLVFSLGQANAIDLDALARQIDFAVAVDGATLAVSSSASSSTLRTWALIIVADLPDQRSSLPIGPRSIESSSIGFSPHCWRSPSTTARPRHWSKNTGGQDKVGVQRAPAWLGDSIWSDEEPAGAAEALARRIRWRAGTSEPPKSRRPSPLRRKSTPAGPASGRHPIQKRVALRLRNRGLPPNLEICDHFCYGL